MVKTDLGAYFNIHTNLFPYANVFGFIKNNGDITFVNLVTEPTLYLVGITITDTQVLFSKNKGILVTIYCYGLSSNLLEKKLVLGTVGGLGFA